MQTAPRPVAPYKLNHSAFGLRHSAFSSAFTLTELLVVIGIIIILVGILLPVVSKIRYAAYSADTQNEISQLSNACTAYYSTYHAYPGPFSADDITGGANPQTGAATLTEIYLSTGSPPVPAYIAQTNDPNAVSPWIVTGAQNLVLGLMGGLRPAVPATTPPTFAFAPAEVGLGPLSLNSANPARTPSFFPAGSNYLMWCQLNSGGQNVQTTGLYQNLVAGSFTGTPFTDPAGTKATDSPIPVFVDRFPSPGPLPILYLRARTGVKGILWQYGVVDSNGNPAYYQYDLREIQPYTVPYPTVANGGGGIGLAKGTQHNLQFLNNPGFLKSTNPVTYYSISDKTIWPNNPGPYFMNEAVTPTDTSSDAGVNSTGRPRSVDQFILISAGPDGIYGTPDDIVSFGTVSP